VKNRAEGISCEGSSGSVAVGIERGAANCGPDDILVGIFADAGIRYLSKWYNDEWMRRQGFLPSPKGA
jgi:cystathionine beta-synthase